MANRKWVALLYVFARQSHDLTNHVSSHDQQGVSDTTLFLCQPVSSFMSHAMANREWVTLLYFFPRQSHQLPLTVPWPTGSEWYCFILCQAVSSIIWPTGSEQHHFISLQGSLINPITNRLWARLLYFSARQSHQLCLTPWPTESEWHYFFAHHLTSHDQQIVSLMKFSHCLSSCYQQSVSDVQSLPVNCLHITNRL